MKKNAILFLMAIFFTSGCVSVTYNDDMEHHDVLEDYNRAMFKFNYQVDKYVLKPVAKGYIAITNEPIRKSVNSVLANILEPVSAANHVLQGEIGNASINISRFGVNTTVGILGIFDVASKIGLTPEKSGFDDTLATWCVPDGPYVILPFLGPATPRSSVGMIVDSYSNPVNIASNSIHSAGDANSVKYGYSGVRIVTVRANSMSLLDDLEKNSIDFYSSMKSAYLQNRASKNCSLREDEVTYDFDFGMDE